LGWNPGDHREIFSLEELVEAFSIERIGKSGTKFDINKAKWFNEQYLRNKSNEALAEYLIHDVKAEGLEIELSKAVKIVEIMKERATFPKDLWQEGKFMLVAPLSFDEDVASKKWNQEAFDVLSAYKETLSSQAEDLTPELAKQLLEAAAESKEIKLGKVMQAVRLAVTGVGAGPDLMAVFAILGKEELVKRISFALETLTVR